MPLITWSDDLSVGEPTLDTDHQVLVGLINQLHDAIGHEDPTRTVARILDALCDYAGYHFAREEEMMRAAGYPNAEAHTHMHTLMRHQVMAMRERYRRAPETTHAREVLAFLTNWLQTHVVGRDKQLQPYLARLARLARQQAAHAA